MNATPVISKIDEQNIRWDTPTFPSLVTRTIEVFKDGIYFRTDTIQSSGAVQINNLNAGTWKIRYTVSSNSDPVSDFSNEIVLGALTETSETPTIISYDATTTDNCSTVNLSGVTGGVLYYQKNGGQSVFIGVISRTDGLIDNPICLESGVYTFTQIENGKNESIATSSITITDPVITQSCDNGSQPFAVSSITYNAGLLQFIFNADNFDEGTWKIKQGNTEITSGTVLPSGNNPTISVGSLADGNYTFELMGVSCVGTAIGSFTVAQSSQSCDLPTGSISADKSNHVVGENAVLTVSGLSNQTAMQWFKNGSLISGQNSTTLTVSNLQLSNNGDVYQLYLENNCGGDKTTSSNLTNEVTLNVHSNPPKRYFVCAKMELDCQAEVIQFGYSSTQVFPSVWVDADLTKMLISTGGVTSEVQSGGENYQVKSFDLQAGTYYFYARQKTETINIVFIGSLTVTN